MQLVEVSGQLRRCAPAGADDQMLVTLIDVLFGELHELTCAAKSSIQFQLPRAELQPSYLGYSGPSHSLGAIGAPPNCPQLLSDIAPPSLLGASGLATASLPARIEAFRFPSKVRHRHIHHMRAA